MAYVNYVYNSKYDNNENRSNASDNDFQLHR